jgi:hypothetical protein
LDEEALPHSKRFGRTTASATSSGVLVIGFVVLTVAVIFLVDPSLNSPNNDDGILPAPDDQQQQHHHRRILYFSLQDNDYKTVTPRIGRPLKEEEVVVDEPQQQYEALEPPLFIVPEAQLVRTKYEVPTITRTRSIPIGSAIVDVLSIGSNARPEFVSNVLLSLCLLLLTAYVKVVLLLFRQSCINLLINGCLYRYCYIYIPSLPHNEIHGQITLMYVTFGVLLKNRIIIHNVHMIHPKTNKNHSYTHVGQRVQNVNIEDGVGSVHNVVLDMHWGISNMYIIKNTTTKTIYLTC